MNGQQGDGIKQVEAISPGLTPNFIRPIPHQHAPTSLAESVEEDISDVYEDNELNSIYKEFTKAKGNAGVVAKQLQQQGFSGRKFHKDVIEFYINNIKLLGLYDVYGEASQLLDFECLEWEKFCRLYSQTCSDWSYPVSEKLLRIAIFGNASVKEYQELSCEIAMNYATKFTHLGERIPLQLKPNTGMEGKQTSLNSETSTTI